MLVVSIGGGLTAVAAAQERGTRGEADSDPADDDRAALVQFALDGIDNNRRLIRSLSGVIEFDELHYIEESGKRFRQERVIRREVYNLRDKWRQKVTTTGINFDTGERVPYSSVAVYDGQVTTSYFPKEHIFQVAAGNQMEFRPTKGLGMGYTVFRRDVRRLIQQAQTLELSSGEGPGTLHVHFEEPGEGVLELTLDASSGFLVRDAVAYDPAGIIVGRRFDTAVRTAQIAAALLVRAKEELYSDSDTGNEVVWRRYFDASKLEVNGAVDESRFVLDYLPGALVVNRVDGTRYRVSPVPEPPTTVTSDWRWWLVILNAAFVFAIIILMFRRARMRKSG